VGRVRLYLTARVLKLFFTRKYCLRARIDMSSLNRRRKRRYTYLYIYSKTPKTRIFRTQDLIDITQNHRSRVLKILVLRIPQKKSFRSGAVRIGLIICSIIIIIFRFYRKWTTKEKWKTLWELKNRTRRQLLTVIWIIICVVLSFCIINFLHVFCSNMTDLSLFFTK
jgi:hypothetical protein